MLFYSQIVDDKKNILDAGKVDESTKLGKTEPVKTDSPMQNKATPTGAENPAVLIQKIATGGEPIGVIWGCVGDTVRRCFCLFKRGRLPGASLVLSKTKTPCVVAQGVLVLLVFLFGFFADSPNLFVRACIATIGISNCSRR